MQCSTRGTCDPLSLPQATYSPALSNSRLSRETQEYCTLKLQRIKLLLPSAMTGDLLAEESVQEQTTATLTSRIYTFLWEWLVIHTYLNPEQNPQLNEIGYSTSLCTYEESIELQYIKLCPCKVSFFAEENLI